ncbi:phosphatase PAP2 family protein [Sphingomonas aracearum]|uniref:PAP2 family protein n=1 Tax=Sphingomonas aracearum TaxID=2283317 RepID=A0A369VZF8_9SPHN|nr:phosphatase PAP2 family protein [Sphingomonas aracearum]RDE07179.1 PAP2 family protein [Sphingomonas aracearum]
MHPELPAAEPASSRAPGPLLAAGVAAAGLGLVLGIGALAGQSAFSFDRRVLAALRLPGPGAHPIGPEWLHWAMLDITALGSSTVLTLVVLAAVGLLLAERLWLTAALVAAGTISGSWIVTLVKGHVARARPDLIDRLTEASGMSFPSGHATNSAIIYLTVAALLTQTTPGRHVRAYIFVLAVLLVGLIGISRIYLGVHWTSDVMAGWSFGTIWALAWWLAGARARAALRH